MDTWLQIGMKGGLIVFIDLKPFLSHYIHVSDQHLALHCVWLHVNAPQIRTKISFCSSTMKLFFQQHGPTFPKKTKKKKLVSGRSHRRLPWPYSSPTYKLHQRGAQHIIPLCRHKKAPHSSAAHFPAALHVVGFTKRSLASERARAAGVCFSS